MYLLTLIREVRRSEEGSNIKMSSHLFECINLITGVYYFDVQISGLACSEDRVVLYCASMRYASEHTYLWVLSSLQNGRVVNECLCRL